MIRESVTDWLVDIQLEGQHNKYYRKILPTKKLKKHEVK
jgi:hypothetical protein